MSEHDPKKDLRSQLNQQQQQQNGLQGDIPMNTLLESRVANVLHEQASHIHFTADTHARLMAHLSLRRKQHHPLKPAFAVASGGVLALLLIVALVQSFSHQSTTLAAVRYSVHSTLATPAELAQGGHLASLDPTGQHIVYQAAQNAGVMYTANVQNPYTSNTLAMRDALAASWSPDGSALVATIQSGNSTEPFLALIDTGSYMTPLGHTARAASWSPTIQDQIVYTTQSNGMTQVFETTPQRNEPAHLLTTLHVPMSVQQLVWSPDGHTLALVATYPHATNTAQPARALYLLDMYTYSLNEAVVPGDFTLGSIAWSPNGRYLSYERIDSSGKETIVALESTTLRNAFSIAATGTLDGWNWSPQSDAIAYSDSGKLAAYVLHGTPITFAKSANEQISPFWLPDGRILCLNIVQGTGTLDILATQKPE